MKITKMLLMAGAVAALSSCGGDAEVIDQMEAIESVLTADTENSSIEWKGMQTEDYFHKGTVKFQEGSAMFIDGNLVSGAFKVDMKSISVSDELPAEKKTMLLGDISSEDFFNIAENANVTVSCGPYMDGKLLVTMTISGVEISKSIPAKVTYADGKGSITGSFEIDFAALNAKGFQADPKKPGDTPVSSKVQFELNLLLK
jgi:hypothetical protein